MFPIFLVEDTRERNGGSVDHPKERNGTGGVSDLEERNGTERGSREVPVYPYEWTSGGEGGSYTPKNRLVMWTAVRTSLKIHTVAPTVVR